MGINRLRIVRGFNLMVMGGQLCKIDSKEDVPIEDVVTGQVKDCSMDTVSTNLALVPLPFLPGA